MNCHDPVALETITSVPPIETVTCAGTSVVPCRVTFGFDTDELADKLMPVIPSDAVASTVKVNAGPTLLLPWESVAAAT